MKFNLDKQNVWVSSDFHYGHKNICKGTTEWDLSVNKGHLSCRDFDTVEHMNNSIVNGINNNVQENDILICLGDWSFGGIDNIWNFRKQINCNHIYLVYGNHDHHIKSNKNLNCGGISESAKSLFSYTDHILDFTITANNIKDKQRFFCSHYAHKIWDQRHHDVMHLFGHSHGSLNQLINDKSIDVGIDSAYQILGEYRPFNIREVYDILKRRENIPIDHHNINTN